MVHNLADITPNSTATALKATSAHAAWVTISAPAANSGDIRAGDSTTDATHGVAIAKGTSITFPSQGATNPYDVALIYVYGTSTDKASAVYGTL